MDFLRKILPLDVVRGMKREHWEEKGWSFTSRPEKASRQNNKKYTYFQSYFRHMSKVHLLLMLFLMLS